LLAGPFKERVENNFRNLIVAIKPRGIIGKKNGGVIFEVSLRLPWRTTNHSKAHDGYRGG
jgi:hypothetical protein